MFSLLLGRGTQLLKANSVRLLRFLALRQYESIDYLKLRGCLLLAVVGVERLLLVQVEAADYELVGVGGLRQHYFLVTESLDEAECFFELEIFLELSISYILLVLSLVLLAHVVLVALLSFSCYLLFLLLLLLIILEIGIVVIATLSLLVALFSIRGLGPLLLRRVLNNAILLQSVDLGGLWLRGVVLIAHF